VTPNWRRELNFDDDGAPVPVVENLNLVIDTGELSGEYVPGNSASEYVHVLEVPKELTCLVEELQTRGLSRVVGSHECGETWTEVYRQGLGILEATVVL